MGLRKKFFALAPYSENKSKSTKYIEGLCPLINTGKVGYLSGCPNIELYFLEGRAYSNNEEEHNDTLDAHFLSETKAYPPQECDVDAYIERLKKAYKDKSKKYDKSMDWRIL